MIESVWHGALRLLGRGPRPRPFRDLAALGARAFAAGAARPVPRRAARALAPVDQRSFARTAARTGGSTDSASRIQPGLPDAAPARPTQRHRRRSRRVA